MSSSVDFVLVCDDVAYTAVSRCVVLPLPVPPKEGHEPHSIVSIGRATPELMWATRNDPHCSRKQARFWVERSNGAYRVRVKCTGRNDMLVVHHATRRTTQLKRSESCDLSGFDVTYLVGHQRLCPLRLCVVVSPQKPRALCAGTTFLSVIAGDRNAERSNSRELAQMRAPESDKDSLLALWRMQSSGTLDSVRSPQDAQQQPVLRSAHCDANDEGGTAVSRPNFVEPVLRVSAEERVKLLFACGSCVALQNRAQTFLQTEQHSTQTSSRLDARNQSGGAVINALPYFSVNASQSVAVDVPETRHRIEAAVMGTVATPAKRDHTSASAAVESPDCMKRCKATHTLGANISDTSRHISQENTASSYVAPTRSETYGKILVGNSYSVATEKSGVDHDSGGGGESGLKSGGSVERNGSQLLGVASQDLISSLGGRWSDELATLEIESNHFSAFGSDASMAPSMLHLLGQPASYPHHSATTQRGDGGAPVNEQDNVVAQTAGISSIATPTQAGGAKHTRAISEHESAIYVPRHVLQAQASTHGARWRAYRHSEESSSTSARDSVASEAGETPTKRSKRRSNGSSGRSSTAAALRSAPSGLDAAQDDRGTTTAESSAVKPRATNDESQIVFFDHS